MNLGIVFALIAVAIAVGVVVAVTRSNKPSPKTPTGSGGAGSADPVEADSAHALLREMLTRRTSWSLQGTPADALAGYDRLIARVLASAPQLETLGQSSVAAIRPLVLGAEPNAADISRREAALEELLILTSSPMTTGSLGAFDESRAWWERVQALPPLQRVPGEVNAWIPTVRVGDYLEVVGELGEVTNVHRYAESYQGESWTWFEIVMRKLRDGQKTGLDWEDDDDIEMWRTVVDTTLEDVGLSASRLKEIYNQDEGVARWGNQTYEYSDGGEATYFKDGLEPGVRFMYLEFEGSGGKSVTAEDWGSEQRAFVAETVNRNSVRLYRA
jgi:hypothetical protein